MADEQRQRIRELFDQASSTYDSVGVEFFSPIARRLVAELAPRSGERGLDVGCGRGAVLFPFAKAVGPGGRVTGIDLSPRMIEMTAADAGAYRNVEVRVGDAMAPDLEAASIDVIAASLVLFFLPEPASALQAWRALLVDRGRIGVSTFGPYSASWRAVDEVFKPYLPPGMADPRTQGEESPFASDSGVERLLTAAGFVSVRTAVMTVPVRFENQDHWHRWTWSVGQRRMWEAVPEQERGDVRALAYERLERCRDDQGRIGFDQLVRFTLGRR